MEAPQDANLVGMSVIPLDVCHFSRFIHKETFKKLYKLFSFFIKVMTIT